MIEELKNAIRDLSMEDWTVLNSWMLFDERKRRAMIRDQAAAQVEQIRQLREKGFIRTPEPESEYSNQLVYLPGELVTLEGDVYIVVGDLPTSSNPLESSDWGIMPM